MGAGCKVVMLEKVVVVQSLYGHKGDGCGTFR